jgi:hypothetical protein
MSKNALGFKKSEYVKPVSGIATIKAGKNGKGRVTFQDEEIKFSTGNNSMVVSLDDLPDIPAIAPETEDDYFVKFNPDTDEIFYIGPVQTTLNAKLVDFSRPEEGSDPLPFEKTNEKYNTTYWAFNAVFQIKGGQFNKLKLYQFHHYKFCENPQEPGYAMFEGDPDNKKAIWLPKLVNLCEKCELVTEPIQWIEIADGSILPELLNRALDNDKIVKLAINKGYIDSIMSSHKDEVEDVEEDDTESTPKAKSNGKATSSAKAPKRVKSSDTSDDDL